MVVTGHPSSPAFTGALDFNTVFNVPRSLQNRISSHPHEWGIFADTFAQQNRGRFTRIIAADCPWVECQHENLIWTMLWFLVPRFPIAASPPSSADSSTGASAANSSEKNALDSIPLREGKIWIVAGFHTGRAIVASFFETAVRMGLVVEDIYERDLNASEEEGGIRRDWTPLREGEGPDNRKRWCVIAILKKDHSLLMPESLRCALYVSNIFRYRFGAIISNLTLSPETKWSMFE
jgi:EEF1A N-terminal glycine/lysine methyltransferase